MARRIVDLTKPLSSLNGDGAFAIREFEVEGEGHSVHHRVEMEAGVGTHVVAPRRLLRWGAAINDLPAETFFGEGLAARFAMGAEATAIGPKQLEAVIGNRLQHGDIVVLAASGDAEQAPQLGAAGAQWLKAHGAKLVAIDDRISLGSADEGLDERRVLTALLENGLPLIRGLVNTEGLSGERFAIMALPVPAEGLDAWPVRVIVLDPGEPAPPEAIEEAVAKTAGAEQAEATAAAEEAAELEVTETATAETAGTETAVATAEEPSETKITETATAETAGTETAVATAEEPSETKITETATAETPGTESPGATAKGLSEAKAKTKTKAKAKTKTKTKAKAKAKTRASAKAKVKANESAEGRAVGTETTEAKAGKSTETKAAESPAVEKADTETPAEEPSETKTTKPATDETAATGEAAKTETRPSDEQAGSSGKSVDEP